MAGALPSPFRPVLRRGDLADRPAPPPPFLCDRQFTRKSGLPHDQARRRSCFGAGAYPRAEFSPRTQSRTLLPSAPSAVSVDKPLPIDLPTALALAEREPARHPDRRRARPGGRRPARPGEGALAAEHRPRRRLLPPRRPDPGHRRARLHHQQVVVPGRGRADRCRSPSATRCYAPLAARQVVRARQADVQAARNDTTLAVAEAYFTVQQARGEVAGSIDALRRAEELVKLSREARPGPRPDGRGQPGEDRAGPPPAGRRGRLRAVAGRQRRPDPPAPARTRHARRAGRGARTCAVELIDPAAPSTT